MIHLPKISPHPQSPFHPLFVDHPSSKLKVHLSSSHLTSKVQALGQDTTTLSKRDHLVAELLSSEEKYIKGLQVILKDYLAPLSHNPNQFGRPKIAILMAATLANVVEVHTVTYNVSPEFLFILIFDRCTNILSDSLQIGDPRVAIKSEK